MRDGRTFQIAKRDGSFEPFSLEKLRRCLAAAMRSCHFDDALANPLAEAIAIHLRYRDDVRLLTSAYVYECVLAVLRHTELDQAAEALEARRAERDVPAHSHERSAAILPASLAAELMECHGLRPATARILADEIAGRAGSLGYATLTPIVKAQLFREELAAWGLTDVVGDELAVPEAPPAGHASLIPPPGGPDDAS